MIQWFKNEVQNAILEFMWDGKPPKLKYHTAIGDTCNGGIKLPDIHTYIVAQNAMWAKRLQESDDLHFMSYLESFLSEMQIEDILKLSVNPESLADETPLFL